MNSMSDNGSTPPPEQRYRLLPALLAGRLGSAFYLYDRNLAGAPILHVPTQKVSEQVYSVVTRLRETNPEAEPWPIERFAALFTDEKERAAVDLLYKRGYIEPCAPPALSADTQAPQQGDDAARATTPYRELIDAFEDKDAKHFFNRPRLFSLPRQIDDGGVDVGFMGVPLASNPQSVGTMTAPFYLRLLTQRVATWFDIHRDGFWSDMATAGTLPRVLCKGLVVQDYGDFAGEAKTIAALFAEVRWFVGEAARRGIPMVYWGGDHAVTFPLVDAYIRQHPDLCLIHFDAHNDLFYSEHITYNHTAPISNLLLYSGLKSVHSFGLRTDHDRRVKNLERITSDPELVARLHLHSIGSLKRLLGEPARFTELLAGIGSATPCYLTVDLDVLSAGAIASQLSTPAGAGIEWWELFEAVDIVLRTLNVVACDVVELNILEKAATDDARLKPAVLLLQLFDGLARCRRHRESARETRA